MNGLLSSPPAIRPIPRFPLALWKRGVLVAAAAFLAVLAGLLLYGRYPWWLCVLGAGALAVVIPLRLQVGERAGVYLSRLCFLCYPFFGYCLVEILNGHNPLTDFSPLYLALNLAFYYLIALLLYLITGRTKLSAGLSLGLFWFIGLANRYVYNFRGRAILPGDLLSLGTAANVAANYDYTPSAAQLGTGLICLVLILALLIPPRQKGRARLRLRSALPVGLACLVFVGGFFFTSILSDRNIKPSTWDTRADGYALHFALCLYYSRTEPPEGYSQEALAALADGASGDVPAMGDGTADTTPVNIIVVMNEAFSDLSVLGDLETNRDPLPFFHSLTENTVRGTAYVSVFGGTTANSEYEFLTGHTTAFFSPGTIPYQMYVKPDSASLVGQMDDLGYRTIAMHPFYASGWNRPTVYADFGFDEVLFYDSFQNLSYVRSYISDQADYENIVRLYEEKEPGEKLFFFNVTMQNHSSYDQPWDNLPREVWLTGDKEGLYPTVDQYLSLLYQSDRALEYLMDYFSQVEEPTLLLVFGDHQPQVYGTFYQDMLGTDLSAPDAQKKQAVPFLIWANYDIPERSGLQLSLNYLSSLLVETAGLPQTGYQQFLAGLWEDLPVVNAVGYLDGEGTWAYAPSGLSQAAQAAILDYQMLQYNEVFDRRRNLLPDFFTLP